LLRCVVVTPDGWSAEDVPPADVVFQAAGAALPDPARGGSVEDLRLLLGWRADDPRWLLVKGWLPCSLLADMPRPVLLLLGTQGSAKSTTGRFLTGVIDPKPKGVLGGAFGKKTQDDETKALGSYLPGWDNVSNLSEAGADFLSRMVTGEHAQRRMLYTDFGLVSVFYRRTGVVTAINMPRGVKPDTLDRLVVLHLSRIEGERQSERTMDARWQQAQPRVLAGVLDLAVHMLAGLHTAENPAGLRMADYAEALWAIDPELYEAYHDNVTTARGDMAHDDPFVGALVRWLRDCPDHTWEGTAEDAQQAGIFFVNPGEYWPKDGRALSSQLNSCSELLRAVGLSVEAWKGGGKRKKRFVLSEPSEPE
jgi:energy-coupling factor transporter ATP-binding protein EcfA2